MKQIEKRAGICLILAMLLLAGLSYFVICFIVKGPSWAAAPFNRHYFDSKGHITAGTVTDCNDAPLFAANGEVQVYAMDTDLRKATLHAVGDLDGNIGTGAISAYAKKLTGYDLINGAYDTLKGGTVKLSIDAGANARAYSAMAGRKGAVMVYNYKTGQVICMYSAPTFDPMSIPEDISINPEYDGAYLNRGLSATFTPGSVFKTVTSAAAIESIEDIDTRTWDCTGSIDIGGNKITCTKAHGHVDLTGALADSCNVAFAQMGVELGSDTLTKYATKAGLLSSYTIDTYATAIGSLNLEKADENKIAWASVGQNQDLINPCALMVYMGAIAEGGRAAKPHILEESLNSFGIRTYRYKTEHTDTLIESSTATRLAEMMSACVDRTYGRENFPNMDICAKSGTAEVGGDYKPNAWFAGFLRDADKPYAFVVVVENGGSGFAVAGKVAAEVLKEICGE